MEIDVMSFNFVNNHSGYGSIGEQLQELFQGAKNEIVIIAPYIAKNSLISGLLKLPIFKIRIITKISLNDCLVGASDLNLLMDLEKNPRIEIRYFSNLHAKIYMVDKTKVMITSANFTQNGLFNNMEYGVIIEACIDSLIEDTEILWHKASIFNHEMSSKLFEQFNAFSADAEETYLDIRKKIYPIEQEIIPQNVSHMHIDSSKKNHPIFFIKTEVRNVDAMGINQEDGFVVLTGSKASKDLTPSFPNSYKKLRDQLIEEGIMIEKENVYVFTKDYKFDSSSPAAIIVMGRSATGLG
ncbi:MAG: DUF4357 domain-containing protein [Clostridiales bacterium]|nr:DUF4357 domain-containing protein [Clostridiales bacterium]